MFARATIARIFEIFSSSCSSHGFGTRNSRCRSSPGHDAVAQQRQHHLLGHVEPLRADVPALVVEEHLVARAEQIGDGLFELLARASTSGFHSRWSRAPAGAVRRSHRRRAQGARELLGPVRGRVRVLGAGQRGASGQAGAAGRCVRRRTPPGRGRRRRRSPAPCRCCSRRRPQRRGCRRGDRRRPAHSIPAGPAARCGRARVR